MFSNTPPHMRQKRRGRSIHPINGGIKFCWQDGCKEVVKGRLWHCPQHQLETYESYCRTSFCYYKVCGESYCSRCQLTLYPETYAKPCSANGFCSTKILKNSASNYCAKHSDFCWSYNCNNRKSENEKYCFLHLGQNRLQPLVRQKTSLSNIQEVIRFETW